MRTSQLETPNSDELEVSLFGPGYGESIVLHLGHAQWVIIDSYYNPKSTNPAPLQYLRDLNVDVARSVKLIVITHWHDDHVRGISTIFRECKSAKVAISAALRSDQFRKLIGLFSDSAIVESSGLSEFIRIFQLLEERKMLGARLNPPTYASQDTLLYSTQIPLDSGVVQARVCSLSPANASILQSHLSFAELLPKEEEHKKGIISVTPNQSSVVLWIEVGEHRLLLGSDLECTLDPLMGWNVILDDSKAISGKADIFKIPHHGSKNAHEPRVWSEFLTINPIAIMSPFCQGGSSLPTNDDITRINGLTSNAYITALPRLRRYKFANKIVKEVMESAAKKVSTIDFGWGQIRLRRNITNGQSSWRVKLFGKASTLKGKALLN